MRAAVPGSRGLAIRQATLADAPVLAEMIRSLVLYEGKRGVDHITTAAVEEWFFGAERICRALLAQKNGASLGYAAWYPVFSTFKGGRVLLVENLWVEEQARGSGAGRALLRAVAQEAQARGIQRIELNVREDNRQTQGFYGRLGFIFPGERVCRIEDESLTRLAEQTGSFSEIPPSPATP